MSCPICRKPTDPTYRPFCSRRCADIDLARWFREDYTIPTPLTDDDDSSSDGQAEDDQA